MGRFDPADPRVVERADLAERVGVFADRPEAGRVLAELLRGNESTDDAVVVAIPAGGVPVGAAIAEALALPLDLAVVSKITLPWSTEAGYGAVAFDGSVVLNEPLVRRLGLDEETVRAGIAATREKVRRRLAALKPGAPAPAVAGRTAILVDDGLASGVTLRAAAEAVRRAGARRLVVAVPTGSRDAVAEMARRVDAVYCANVRSGYPYAVADAYRHWRDVAETELARWLATETSSKGGESASD